MFFQNGDNVRLEPRGIGTSSRGQERGSANGHLRLKPAVPDRTRFANVAPSFNNSHACDDSRRDDAGVADFVMEGATRRQSGRIDSRKGGLDDRSADAVIWTSMAP
jgi:hypothetical protein